MTILSGRLSREAILAPIVVELGLPVILVWVAYFTIVGRRFSSHIILAFHPARAGWIIESLGLVPFKVRHYSPENKRENQSGKGLEAGFEPCPPGCPGVLPLHYSLNRAKELSPTHRVLFGAGDRIRTCVDLTPNQVDDLYPTPTR